MDTFWLVWDPQGGAPTHQHPTLQLARGEAERLARMNPGRTFYVLGSCGKTKKTDVEWTDINVDNIPF